MKMCTKKKYANTTFKVRKRHWLVCLRPPGSIGLRHYLLFTIIILSGKYLRITFQKAIANNKQNVYIVRGKNFFPFILGMAFGQALNVASNENESTNHMFANQYLIIASNVLRANTIYKVILYSTVLFDIELL